MILVIDAGSTSMRGIVYNSAGTLIKQYSVQTPANYLPQGLVEQNPECWKKALEEILQNISACINKNTLAAISVTAFRSPIFPVDQDGCPLMPAIMWQDIRSQQVCDELNEYSSMIHERTGSPLNPIFSAPKIAWIQKNHPEIAAKTQYYVGIYEYLLFLLTEQFITDFSVAARSNMLNIHTKNWDIDLLKIFDIKKEKLSPLIEPGIVCGNLSKKMSQKTGLPQGLVIVAAGGDQQCLSLGMGITQQGRLSVNTGTGAYVSTLIEKPLIDKTKQVFTSFSCNKGMYLLEFGLSTAGAIHRWLAELFQFYLTASSKKNPYEIFDVEIKNSPAGSKGLMLFPYFKSKRNCSGGCFVNLSLKTSRGDMGRAALEGISFELERGIELIRQISKNIKGSDFIFSSGGLSRFSMYNQMQANIFDRTVCCATDGEGTARGAWLNALKALSKDALYTKHLQPKNMKIFLPEKEQVKIYRNLKAKWLETAKKLYDQNFM